MIGAVAPARGAPTSDVIFATVLVVGLLVILAGLGFVYLRGQLRVLDRVADASERVTRLPAWAALPFGLSGASLLAAVFGFYWDVSWHIDRGRDPGPFANPAHWWIFLGLLGLAVAGALSVLLGARRPAPTALRIKSLRPPWAASSFCCRVDSRLPGSPSTTSGIGCSGRTSPCGGRRTSR